MVCRELRGLLAAHYVGAGSQGMEKNVVGEGEQARPRAAPSESLPQRVKLPCPALSRGVGGSSLRLHWQAEGAPSCAELPSLPERVAAAGQAAGHDVWPAAWGLWHPGGSFGAATQRLELCCCAPRARGVRLLPAPALAGTWVSRRLTKSLPPMARLCGPAVQPSGAAGPGPAAMGL